MCNKSVYLATCLGILLGWSLLEWPLGMARGAEETEDDVVDTEVLTTPEEEAEIPDEEDEAVDALAPVPRFCSAGRPGDACLFDLTGTDSDTLTVCTQATKSGQRWRTTIAQVNSAGAVSSVGTGSTTACTGSASRSVVSDGKYVAIVTYEGPLPGTFATSTQVQFTGPVTISGPRRRVGDAEEIKTCQQVSESAIVAAAVDVEPITCGTLMTCKINPGVDTDTFTFTAAANSAYAITIAEQSAVAGFPCWELYGPTGTSITSSCGQSASGPLPSSGKYTIQTYGAAGFVGDYALSLQGISASAACGTSLVFGDLKRGRIDRRGDTDVFTFTAAVSQAVSITIGEVTSVTGFPCWELYGPTGTSITSSCGQGASGPLPSSGKYTIRTYGAAGFVGDYRLSLQLISQ